MDGGVVAQFYQNEELFTARRITQAMDPSQSAREMAIAWAEQQRKHIEAYESESA